MGLSGRVGAGAASGLAEMLTRQLEEAQAAEAKRANKAREAQASERLAFDKERFTAEQDARQQDIEQESIKGLRANTDRMDARLTRLQGEEDAMDVEARRKAVLDALPPQLRQMVELGVKPSSDDFQTPQQREEAGRLRVKQVGAEAEARAAAEAKYRPKPEPKPTGPGGLSSGQLTTAKQFQDDYARDSKTYVTVRNAYQQVKGAASKPDAAGDLSLIFGYMKMLDPNSVVRETEFANAQNAAGIPGQIRNAWNRALTGERLNPKQREQFVGQAQRLWQSAHQNQGKVRKTYTDRSSKFGIDPGMVLDSEDPVSDMVKMEAPDGTVQDVPVEKVEMFKAKGAKVVQ